MKFFGKSKKVKTLSTVKIYKDEVCSYKNPVTGQNINWSTRKMDFKPLSEKIANLTTLFTNTEKLNWINIDHIPGNKYMYYATVDGAVPMGVCRIKPGGYFSLHWHNETEHYLVVSGHGRFTIGSEEQDVIANGLFPTLITIPSNMPHQTFNPGTEDLIWYYFFPETVSCKEMRYFYPKGNVYKRWPSNERLEKTLKSSLYVSNLPSNPVVSKKSKTKLKKHFPSFTF